MSKEKEGLNNFPIIFAPLHLYTSVEISEEFLLKTYFNQLSTYYVHILFNMNLTEITVLPLGSY